jgi:hypothetical protein
LLTGFGEVIGIAILTDGEGGRRQVGRRKSEAGSPEAPAAFGGDTCTESNEVPFGPTRTLEGHEDTKRICPGRDEFSALAM